MMFGCVIFQIITIAIHVLANEHNARTVYTHQGPVKGYKLPDYDLFAFYGIPYATAPTGLNRFKAPLPPPTWDKPFEAIEENIICPQSDTVIQSIKNRHVRENCLVTSIYVPNTNKTNLPVVVYVHGGAFQVGFADRLTPKNLVNSKEAIIAMFNYRLGVHGFLCLGTRSIPGNAGMKDQVTFLRWVQKNIASFGGNPNDVTLYGNSAGSRAVDLLMLSKSNSGLFKSVIGESGGSLSAETVQTDPIENAKTFARMLNFENVDDINALEFFYLNTSYELLTSLDTRNLKSYLFTPCVERNLGEEVVLENSPLKILKSGEYFKLPMLYGFTEMEGTYRLDVFEEWKDDMIRNFSDYLPVDLHFSTTKEREDIAIKVKDYYFGDEVINEENILLFVNYFTDTMYVHPMLRAIKLHLEAGHDEIYSYEYSFTSKESSKIPYINIPGAFHSSQTLVFLDFNNNESELSEEFKEMKRIYRDMYFNFITTGKPVPEGSSLPFWPAVQRDNIYIMSLNQTVEVKPLQHRALFWDDIYEKYYREPIPPPVWPSTA